MQEFSKVTLQLNIMYCYPLMTASSRPRSISQSENTHPQKIEQDMLQIARLEAYFPFDPLPLTKAKTFCDEHYQEWKEDDDLSIACDSELSSSMLGVSLDEKLSFSMSLSIG